jgi:hypothetical protein
MGAPPNRADDTPRLATIGRGPALVLLLASLLASERLIDLIGCFLKPNQFRSIACHGCGDFK